MAESEIAINKIALRAAGLGRAYDETNNGQCLTFRQAGRPKVDFYPSTGRWKVVGSHEAHEGGARAFVDWYAASGAGGNVRLKGPREMRSAEEIAYSLGITVEDVAGLTENQIIPCIKLSQGIVAYDLGAVLYAVDNCPYGNPVEFIRQENLKREKKRNARAKRERRRSRRREEAASKRDRELAALVKQQAIEMRYSNLFAGRTKPKPTS